MKTRLIVLSAMAVVALFLTGSAYGAPTTLTCTPGPGGGDACADLTFTNGNIGNIGEVNVLFHGPGTDHGPATTVSGLLNSAHNQPRFLVDFTANAQTGMLESSGGQSDIDSVGSGHIFGITITVPHTADNVNNDACPADGCFFEDLITDPMKEVDTTTASTFRAIVTMADGQVGESALYGTHLTGQNFLTIQSNAAEEGIRSVEIVSATGFDEFKQPRISGIQGMVFAQAPEPGSMLMLGSGVLGIAGILRRKLRRHPLEECENKSQLALRECS